MQESLLSLMQMAKTSAVLAKMSDAHLPFISVMADPTMGGVSASLAMLGDVNIAEPNALIGFAGPRVIEQTVREKLPQGFQRAEFLLEKGAIDMIVARHKMRDEIAELIAKMLGYSLQGQTYMPINQLAAASDDLLATAQEHLALEGTEQPLDFEQNEDLSKVESEEKAKKTSRRALNK